MQQEKEIPDSSPCYAGQVHDWILSLHEQSVSISEMSKFKSCSNSTKKGLVVLFGKVSTDSLGRLPVNVEFCLECTEEEGLSSLECC